MCRDLISLHTPIKQRRYKVLKGELQIEVLIDFFFSFLSCFPSLSVFMFANLTVFLVVASRTSIFLQLQKYIRLGL